MKKWFAMILVFSLFLSACNSEPNSSTKKGVEEHNTAVNTNTHEHVEKLEPAKDEACAFCNMKVYPKEHEMGIYTTMAKDQNGKEIFFDDSGCLLNYERKTEKKVADKMVRDYFTSEWIPVDKAAVVKADIATPMKYGYAFFKDEESAQKFITDHHEQNAIKSSLTEVDEVANKKFIMKMQKMKNEKPATEQEHNSNK